MNLSENAEAWNTTDFSQSLKECLVCCEAFAKNDPIVRMPCNREKHFFHQNCIESWFENNQNCPLCRTVVARVGDIERDPADPRSIQEQEQDEAFERLLAGPMGVPRMNSIQRRSVSLLSTEE